MSAEIVLTIIVCILAIYFQRKEHVKQRKYFGGKRTYNKKEQKVLDYNKGIYKSIPNDERLLNYNRDGFELEDIALTATQMIYNNPIPSLEEQESIAKGNMVKLVFVDNDGYVERMWVEYIGVENKLHKGILRNTAYEMEGLKENMEIFFHSNHIFNIFLN